MQVDDRLIDSIKPYDKNPRKNDTAVEAVALSIKEFGFRQPIVVDSDGVIIVGHTRWKAAKLLGLETVPVHVADLDEAQRKAYRIADNKTGELAEWDTELLAVEIGELQAGGMGVELLGFGAEEVAILTGEVPSDEDWADAMEEDTTLVDGFGRVSFTLTQDDLARLRSHIKSYGMHKNKAIVAWLNETLSSAQ